MKRLFLLILLVVLVAWFTRTRQVRMHNRPDFGPAVETRRTVAEPRRETRRVKEARHEVHRAVQEAKAEVCQTLDEATQEIHHALEEAAQEIRQAVDGIPVPIVPGTRVTEAVPQPPQPPAPPKPSKKRFQLVHTRSQPPQPPKAPQPPQAPVPARPVPTEIRVVAGLISATEERAKAEARKELERQITDWLEPQGVSRSWKASPRQIDAMIVETKVRPVVKDYGTLYVAEFQVDASPERISSLVETYQHQVVNKRMVMLAGLLGFILTCLGAISGYIRADEATKGYYTNRLRMLTAAGVGAAGVVIYQMVA